MSNGTKITLNDEETLIILTALDWYAEVSSRQENKDYAKIGDIVCLRQYLLEERKKQM